jgi:hypothetical protein
MELHKIEGISKEPRKTTQAIFNQESLDKIFREKDSNYMTVVQDKENATIIDRRFRLMFTVPKVIVGSHVLVPGLQLTVEEMQNYIKEEE